VLLLSLRTNSFTWSISSCSLLIDGCSGAFHIFTSLHPTFELGKITPKLLFFLCLLFRCYIQHIESSCNIFLPFIQQNFIDILLIQFFSFLFMPKLQMNQLKLVNKSLLSSHVCCSLIRSRKWLSRLSSLSIRSLC